MNGGHDYGARWKCAYPSSWAFSRRSLHLVAVASYWCLGQGVPTKNPHRSRCPGDLSEECHRQLVADRVITDSEVGDKRDLSAVAEAVVCKTGSQRDLIERFPPDAFRHAEPNEGYLLMAALFLEGALADVLTLNFDSAARTALGRLGVRAQVSTVRSPEDYTHLGTHNLIYLHRDIDSDPDSIILRKEDLEKGVAGALGAGRRAEGARWTGDRVCRTWKSGKRSSRYNVPDSRRD